MTELILPRGRVKWFNVEKGYGFIESPAVDRDVFFHFTIVEDNSLLPMEGDLVEFAMSVTAKGLQATRVRLVG